MNRASTKIISGAVLLLAGGLIIPLAVLLPVLSGPNEKVVFEAPGSATLDIEAPGRFYLWHEFEALFNGERRVHGEALPDGYRFEVRYRDQPLSLVPNDSIARSSPSTESRSIGHVEIPAAGPVEIVVDGPEDQPRILSFSRARIWKILGSIGITLASIALLGGLGTVLLILGIVQRVRDHRR